MLSSTNTTEIARSKLAGPSEQHLVPDRLLVDGAIPTWLAATNRFVEFVEKLEEHNPDAHIALPFPTFTEAWAKAAWSQLYRLDQHACQWATTTVLIPFTGSYWLDKEQNIPLPPVTYLNRLQRSKQARQQALSRVLENVSRWKAVRVIGGKSDRCYPFVFLGVYLSDHVQAKQFDSVVRAHIDNCPIADREAHQIGEVTTTAVSPDSPSNLIHMLGRKLPTLQTMTTLPTVERQQQKMATAIHAGGWRPISRGDSDS